MRSIRRAGANPKTTAVPLLANRMPIDLRISVSLVALVICSLAAWSLRPSQRKPIGGFSLARRRLDPVMRATFNAKGYPRKYAWYAPLLIFAIILALVWAYGGT